MDHHQKKYSELNSPTPNHSYPIPTDNIEALSAADYITKKLLASVNWNITSRAINKRIPRAVSHFSTGIIELTTLKALSKPDIK